MKNEWVKNLIPWLKQIEEKNYIWSLHGNDTCKLGASALFAKLATIYSNHHSFNKEKIKDNILSFRQQDGTYSDNDVNGVLEWIAETRQAMSGLYNLGYDIGEFVIPERICSEPLFFMSNRAWNQPYGTGAQLSHYLFFNRFKNNIDKIEKVIFELNNRFKKKEGWYNKRPSNVQIINGAMKIFTGYDAVNLELDENHLRTILDFILKTNSSTGGCNIYDYVYVLTKCMDIEYKISESKNELEKQYNKILTYQQSDGGFSYNKNRSKTEYYTAKNITPGFRCGDIHGTTLFSMALSRIDKYLGLDLGLELAFS